MDEKLVMLQRSGGLGHPSSRTILLSCSPTLWNMMTLSSPSYYFPPGHNDEYSVDKESQMQWAEPARGRLG
jgi:hypothetical protein